MKNKDIHSPIYGNNFKKTSWFKDWLMNPKLFKDYAGIRKWAALFNKTKFGHMMVDKLSTHFPKITAYPNEIFWIWNRFRNPKQYYQFADDHKWVFILGCNNSGTTLVHDLLAYHSDIASLPMEGQCLTLSLQQTKGLGVGRIWTEKMELLQMTEEDPVHNSAQLIHDWKNYLDNVNAGTIIEKSPVTLLRPRWFQKVFKNSYFIGITRDGRAVAEGISRRKEDIDIFRSVTHWEKSNEYLLESSSYLKNYKQIKYEDLVANPEETIAELLDFIKVDPKNYNHDFKDKLVIHNIDEKPAEVINFNQKSFDRIPKETFDQLTERIKPMMKKLGYANY